MASTADSILKVQQSLFEERRRCLAQLLEFHTACLNGVTAREAAEWLGLEPGRASETSAGILLYKLGYHRYRKRADNKEEQRLFPDGRAPVGWVRK